MKLLKPVLYTYTAALALGALSMGFAPAAQAVSTYDAAASFSLTLTDVTDLTGFTVTSGWSVDAFGSGVVDLFESGDASASGTTSVVDPAVSLSILDGITQTSTASGIATDGVAETFTFSDLDITVDNFSGQNLTFSFDYDIMAVVMAIGDDALANTTVDMLDDLGFVDILAIADASAMSGSGSSANSQFGTIQFTLSDDESNIISGFVDSSGTAASVVPVPAAVWLFGSGLIGLVGVARRKKT